MVFLLLVLVLGGDLCVQVLLLSSLLTAAPSEAETAADSRRRLQVHGQVRVRGSQPVQHTHHLSSPP